MVISSAQPVPESRVNFNSISNPDNPPPATELSSLPSPPIISSLQTLCATSAAEDDRVPPAPAASGRAIVAVILYSRFPSLISKGVRESSPVSRI